MTMDEKSQPTFEPFEDDGVPEKFKELLVNEELIDLFCEEMKKRIRVGDISFIENNKWLRLNNEDKKQLVYKCKSSDFYSDYVATALYSAMQWYND